MLSETLNSTQAELKQLWGGGTVPPLTKEETELSLKLWRKIKKRKQREQQPSSRLSVAPHEDSAFGSTHPNSWRDEGSFAGFSTDSPY